jgi:hypothetical protein
MAAKKSVSTGRTGTSKAALKVPKIYDTREARNRKLTRKNVPAAAKRCKNWARTGTDAYSGILDHRKIRGTDDILITPLHCGTQWDGLGDIMYEDTMWNGYDCRTASSAGAAKGGIEKTKERVRVHGQCELPLWVDCGPSPQRSCAPVCPRPSRPFEGPEQRSQGRGFGRGLSNHTTVTSGRVCPRRLHE